MTRWSWVIDQRKCIGCHACTTACKSENDVAVGVFRTWVKNVDVGEFPAVRRNFAVLRCNHCEDAPCVEICPVTAMYQREDGLVDFDEDRCIGCKACMQACPYDAIYIDPKSHTAQKCNFCSHRVDEGLLPACVVVCPVEALVFGDMDDPASKVSRELASVPAKVRRPEQRTKPKAFYLGAHPDTLDPLAVTHGPTYAWSENRGPTPPTRKLVNSSTVSYDIPKSRPWGWKVSAYIWTKSIAAGAGFVPAVMRIAGMDVSGALFTIVAPLIALIFLGLTGLLLVADLKRPERFWTILTRPQWRSWLARGAFVITGYGAALTAWGAASWLGDARWTAILAWPVAVLALFTAVYTAFLFSQCEGRDLWQTRLLAAHLALHTIVAGVSALMLAGWWRGAILGHRVSFGETVIVTLILATILALGDAFAAHPTPNARAAAHAMTRGKRAPLFWMSMFGAVIPVAIFAVGPFALYPVAAATALACLFLHGHALVLAGQDPPIS